MTSYAQQGWDAFGEGKKLPACPFNGKARRQWQRGWLARKDWKAPNGKTEAELGPWDSWSLTAARSFDLAYMSLA